MAKSTSVHGLNLVFSRADTRAPFSFALPANGQQRTPSLIITPRVLALFTSIQDATSACFVVVRVDPTRHVLARGVGLLALSVGRAEIKATNGVVQRRVVDGPVPLDGHAAHPPGPE